ncbi:hypothetical protein TNCT_122001 [Trichonephila clavata]|uniref:Uncharacterized protein n=1 Tax=Trichonephila clavata TaxID=2740835 RepID=A0A8X6GTF3_TRICU|nr:hypothetical protein TNCT_122001 [Trichonephila clavata]
MRDELTFSQGLVKYSAPDFGDFAMFLKEYRNSLNALQVPAVFTVNAFLQHFHDLVALCDVLCPSKQCGKLISLPCLCFYEPSKSRDHILQRMAKRGHGAYIRGLWTECMKPDLYRKATVAWYYGGSQDLDQWVTLGHTALQLLYSAPFPDSVFQVPDKYPIYLEPMTFLTRPNVDTLFIKIVGPRVPPAPYVGRLNLEC